MRIPTTLKFILPLGGALALGACGGGAGEEQAPEAAAPEEAAPAADEDGFVSVDPSEEAVDVELPDTPMTNAPIAEDGGE